MKVPRNLKKYLKTKRSKIGVIFLAVILLNLILFLYFEGRTYPRSRMAQKDIGHQSISQVEVLINSQPLLADKVTFTSSEKSQTLSLAELGIKIDKAKTLKNVKNQNNLAALIGMFKLHEVPVGMSVNQQVFEKRIDKLVKDFSGPALDARIVIQDGIFQAAAPASGFRVDKSLLVDNINQKLSQGEAKVKIEGTVLKPKPKQQDLTAVVGILRSQQNTPISFIHARTQKKVMPDSVSSWYKPVGNQFELSDELIKNYLSSLGNELGIKVKNLDQAAFQARNAVQATKAADIVLTAEGITKTYTYCALLRGVNESYLSSFITTLQEVYTDPRGWSLGGQINLEHANQGCNFSIWLAAADQMSTFGGDCDSDWSCRSGNNVAINFNRWRFASESWNIAGGNLQNYRVLAINHETGHWFGLGHPSCPASGSPAPVMMQQSINLSGCKFNSWPLVSEQNSLRLRLGLP